MACDHYANKDNKPLTLRELKAILNKVKGTLALDRPVLMSSDEEGNDILKLWGVEIEDKGGQVTLWPAHDYSNL